MFAVTTRGRGGSEFLDTITQHGGGTIGNQMDLIQNNILNFLTKEKWLFNIQDGEK